MGEISQLIKRNLKKKWMVLNFNKKSSVFSKENNKGFKIRFLKKFNIYKEPTLKS